MYQIMTLIMAMMILIDVPDSSVDVVPTGDSSDMRILIMLMAVSGLAIGMTVAKSKNSLKAFK